MKIVKTFVEILPKGLHFTQTKTVYNFQYFFCTEDKTTTILITLLVCLNI